MKDIISAVKGFEASGASAGLRKGDEPDVALILSRKEAVAAGVFTLNKVAAAPVVVSREHVANGEARAILANAGYANACTGDAGLSAARRSAEVAAGELDLRPDEVLLASTGVIGQLLDVELISKALPGLAASLSPEGLPSAARAIMTTDSFPKISAFEGNAGGKPYRIVGIAKGAGMIMPHMATMLSFVVSDIRIDAVDLNGALLSSVEATFNRISVDGDTSTNDTVLALANGMADNRALSEKELRAFTQGLREVTGALAGMIVQDGEGATRVFQVRVRGAADALDAERAARTVANSSLVKTAVYGRDANWGRIMAALGRSGVVMDETLVDIWIDEVQIVAGGLGMGAPAEEAATERMGGKKFVLTVDLHKGDYADAILTCDLTHEYVTINADYRT